VHHRGKQVNPQKLKMVPHQVLKGQQLEKYIAARDEIEETMKLLKKKSR
jgi:hypothetical protein